MKNKGCLKVLFMALIGLLSYFLLTLVAYRALVPQRARQMSLFHSQTISFDNYYTVVPTGSWFDRTVTIALFTLLLWFVFWLLALIVKKLLKASQTTWADRWILRVILFVFIWSMLATLFRPKRKVVFDTKSEQVVIKDYQSLFYIWPLPFGTETRVLPFEAVEDVRFAPYQSHIMGATHEEIELRIITSEETIVVGASLVFHGEFGWLINRNSAEETVEANKLEANRIATELLELVKGAP